MKTRRKFIAQGAASLATPFFFTQGLAAQEFANVPTGPGDRVTFGFLAPQTGPLAEEGVDQLRAFELAVEHINGGGDGGMLGTLQPLGLTGNGILGRKVEFTTGDTQTKIDAARASARSLIERDGATMLSGSSTLGEALGISTVSEEARALFMAGSVLPSFLTNRVNNRYNFRHFANSGILIHNTARFLAREFGGFENAVQILPESQFGEANASIISAEFQSLGWGEGKQIRLSNLFMGGPGPAPALRDAQPDIIVLNGGPRFNATVLDKLRNSGLNDELNAPRVALSLSDVAAGQHEEILVPSSWHWTLTDEASKIFVRSFGSKFGFPPSQVAHTCYVQVLLYANACELAGSFAPPAIWEVMEGLEFSGTGNLEALYNGADHQVYQATVIARTRGVNSENEFETLEIVEFDQDDLCRCQCKGTDICKDNCCSSEFDETT